LESNSDFSERIIFSLIDVEILLILILTVTISVVLLSCKNRILNFFQAFRSPNVDVISQHLRPIMERSHPVMYVDIRLCNHGGPGAITVWIELLQGKNAWKRSLRFHLEPKQIQDITFRISDDDLLITDKVDYRISIE